MADLAELFERNRAWAAATVADNPDVFVALAKHQAPAYLWIGCSDSRVPANQIVGLAPGDVRNKADSKASNDHRQVRMQISLPLTLVTTDSLLKRLGTPAGGLPSATGP